MYYIRQINTCSKSTIETLEKGVKYVYNKDNRMTSFYILVYYIILLLNLNKFHTFF